MSNIDFIIEEKVMPVSMQLTTPLEVTQAGVVDSQLLDKAKKSFIRETVGVWANELVRTNEGYPKDKVSEVLFDIDAVILKRGDFEKIKEFIQGGTSTINNDTMGG